MVYIGKNSTRYHVNAGCHYLHNDLTAVSAQEVEYKRSQDGSRYTPCSRCGNSAGNTVYILPSGRHYHSSPSCTAINAYVISIITFIGIPLPICLHNVLNKRPQIFFAYAPDICRANIVCAWFVRTV